jgi:hypothetical protein
VPGFVTAQLVGLVVGVGAVLVLYPTAGGPIVTVPAGQRAPADESVARPAHGS